MFQFFMFLTQNEICMDNGQNMYNPFNLELVYVISLIFLKLHALNWIDEIYLHFVNSGLMVGQVVRVFLYKNQVNGTVLIQNDFFVIVKSLAKINFCHS